MTKSELIEALKGEIRKVEMSYNAHGLIDQIFRNAAAHIAKEEEEAANGESKG